MSAARSTRSPLGACRRCNRRHPDWLKLAACHLAPVLWIVGNPDAGGACFALISDCVSRRPSRTASLWATRQEAERQKAVIDATGCGARCRRAHRVVELERGDE